MLFKLFQYVHFSLMFHSLDFDFEFFYYCFISHPSKKLQINREVGWMVVAICRLYHPPL